MSNIRKLLYRYFTAEKALDLIYSEELFFTPPKYLNDINEFTPSVEEEITDEMFFNQFYKEELVRDIYDKSEQMKKLSSFADYFKVLRNDPKERKFFKEAILSASNKIASKLQEIFSDYYGVACFASRMDNKLMWAYYAESSKGICIGFDFDFKNTQLQYGEKGYVSYEPDRILIPNSFFYLDEQEQYQYFKEIIFRKGKEWEYEEEYRIVTEIKKNCQTKKVGDASYYYQALNLNDIHEIYLGPRFSAYKDLYKVIESKNIAPDIYQMDSNFNAVPYEVR